MKKYNDKYRIPTTRPSWKNYADRGSYFVTVNTKHRSHFFGSVQNGIVCLSDIGTIAYNEWLKTLSIRPDMNLTLHAHIVMPDHFHAVISIGANPYNQETDNILDENPSKDALPCFSPNYPPPTLSTTSGTFGPQRKNLSSIMRGYKTSVTIQARKINPDFGWQNRFYDIIIKDEKALGNTIDYIERNPMEWSKKHGL